MREFVAFIVFASALLTALFTGFIAWIFDERLAGKPVAALVLNLIALLLNGAGLWLAVSAVLAEGRGRGVPIAAAMKVERAYFWMLRKLHLDRRIRVHTGFATGSTVHVGSAASGYVHKTQPQTDDPAENRIRVIEDELARMQAERSRDNQLLDQRFKRSREDVNNLELRISTRLDLGERKDQEVLGRALNKEMLGLVLVALGTLLQGIVQLFGP